MRSARKLAARGARADGGLRPRSSTTTRLARHAGRERATARETTLRIGLPRDALVRELRVLLDLEGLSVVTRGGEPTPLPHRDALRDGRTSGGPARRLVADAGLEDQIEIRVAGYRELADEPFDAVASIGMIEHGGARVLGIAPVG